MESQLKVAEEDLDYLQKQYMKTGSESDKALFEEYYSEYETHFEEFQSKVNEYNAFYELFQKKVEEYNIKANIFNGNN